MSLLESQIYIVDDEPHNLLLLNRMLSKQGYVNITTNGDPLLAIRDLNEGSWDLLLLDMNMPALSGLDLLKLIQPLIRDTPPLPVLVLTGDPRADTRRAALNLGAKDFVAKPFDPPEVMCRIGNLLESRLFQKRLLDQNDQLDKQVKKRTAQLLSNQLDSVRRLGLAAEYRDDNTGRHILRVSTYAIMLSYELGESEDFVTNIGYAAQLHDIGKLAIPDSILTKPGPLDDEQWATMKQHVRLGAEILSGSECPILRMAEAIALYHHERWDGKGYLHSLKANDIPTPARILSVCDVFDALTSERPYKRAWSIDEALEEMVKNRGTQFDPDMLDHFVKVVGNLRVDPAYASLIGS